MKILWLSNRILEQSPDKQSGTWLTSLAPELIKNDSIKLANISNGNVKKITRRDSGKITQWVIPKAKRKRDGLPSRIIVNSIRKIVLEYRPDIIHVWGTENYWGLLTSRGIISGKYLLSMQGIISAIAPVYYGGLNFEELIKCFGIKEIIKPNQSLFFKKRLFKKYAKWEVEIIKKHKYIITQSDWVRSHIKIYNNNFINFSIPHTIRSEFLKSKPWYELNLKEYSKPILFTLVTIPPYKGLHVLIKSLGILVKKYPNIELNIGGVYTKSYIKKSGYEKWLLKLIKSLGLNNNINWLGQLDSSQIIYHLQNSRIFIHPSFVESYSLTVAEAMCIGTPSVISFSSALSDIAEHRKSALFFSPGDYVDLSRKIEELLLDFELSKKISINSNKNARNKYNTKKIVCKLIDVYNKIADIK